METYVANIAFALSNWLGNRSFGMNSRPLDLKIMYLAQLLKSPWQYFFLYMPETAGILAILSLKKGQACRHSQSGILSSFY